MTNRWYFTAWATFGLLGGLLTALPQPQLLLWINDQRSAWGDWLFPLLTRGGEIYGFLLALVLLATVGQLRRGLAILPLGLSIAGVAYLFKKLFQHPRPARLLPELGLWSQIEPLPHIHLHTGYNSFPSGHTLTAFALLGFVALSWPYKRGGALALFGLALGVGISRVYLLQHFFKDIYLGAMLGTTLAWGMYWWVERSKWFGPSG